MKYTNLKQLPFRPRLAIALLYLTATAIMFTAGTISVINNYAPGYYTYMILATVMLIHLIRRRV